MWRHFRENFGRYLLCSLLMVVGISAFCTSTFIDYDYWSSVAKNDMAKLEYGGGAIIFRSVTLLFACVVAMQWRQGTLGGVAIGGVAALVLFSFASVGMSSIVGFGARERLVPYTQAMANADAQKQAFEESKARRQKLEDDQISFLRDQARKAKGVQSRQAAYDALGTATFGSTEVVAAPKIAMASDPQAEAIHALFPNWSIEGIQLATTFAFGIGLIIAEMVCMGFGVGLWPHYVAKAKEASKRDAFPADVAEPEPFLSAKVIHPPQFAREPEAIPYEPTLIDMDVHEHLTSQELVSTFWKQESSPCPGNRILASAAYRHFLTWCEENDHPAATQQMFGRVSGKIIPRFMSAQWFYLDRVLNTRHDDDAGQIDSLMVA